MKFTFGIKERVVTSAVLFVAIIAVFGTGLLRQVKQRDELIRKVTGDYQPSVTLLQQLTDKYGESRKIAIFLSQVPAGNDSALRVEFNSLFHTEIPKLTDELIGISSGWDDEDRQLMFNTSRLINDSLYYSYLALPGHRQDEARLTEENRGMQGSDLPILASEIEQDLGYLTDKRQQGVNDIFAEISNRSHLLTRDVLIVSLMFILILITIVVVIYRHLRNSIGQLRENLHLLSTGRIPEKMKIPQHSEFTNVNQNLNHLFDYLKTLTAVSERILNRDFTSDFRPLGHDDELGNALVNLQKNLKKATEDEQTRKEEDEQREWVSNSITGINDILRSSGDDVSELGYELIENLVSITGSSVGGLFVINNDRPGEPVIELVASYAYDRRKQLNKQIGINEGLIGRCVFENETISLTDVPPGYITIQTGLGENDPRSILIVPLHFSDSVYGVIELASLSQFPEHVIRFVENAGENIATTLSKVKVNLRTSYLLRQTRQQAEEMSAQEEEMRQNMKELRAIQEQSALHEEKLLKEISILRQKLRK